MTGLSYKEMSEWRIKMSDLLEEMADICNCDVEVINPVEYYNFVEKRHQSEREVMQYDLNHVKTSDIIIVDLFGINSSIGTCIELYEAHDRNIPVIAIDLIQKYDDVHPWIKECITRVENSYENAAEYIRDFYML